MLHQEPTWRGKVAVVHELAREPDRLLVIGIRLDHRTVEGEGLAVASDGTLYRAEARDVTTDRLGYAIAIRAPGARLMVWAR